MIHKATIKSEINKQFPDILINEITHHGFGVFSVKVFKHTSRTIKIGLLFGRTDFDKRENGVDLDKKIDWIGSI